MAKPAPRKISLIVHFDGTDMSELNTAAPPQSDDRLAFAGS